MANFKEECYQHVFVKSSTGFYKTADNLPNGATLESIIMMLENASPLQVKASGGVSNQKIALQYIQLGVKRIGTSSAKALIENTTSNSKTY
jgi:deoxyribose-phosphate aldolase